MTRTNECWIEQKDCERGCAEQFSDGEGKLTVAREACEERCDAQQPVCDHPSQTLRHHGND